MLAVDAARRRVVVGPRDAGRRTVRLREVNWLVTPGEVACAVKLRARDGLREAVVRPDGDGAVVELAEPALAAAGQGCVFYAGTRVLGGGFISG